MTLNSAQVQPTTAQFRFDVREWLAVHGADLDRRRGLAVDLDGEMQYNRHVYRLLWDDGLSRWGWPESAGGRGGSPLLRAVLAEEMTFAGLAHQNAFTMPEVLGAPFASVASPALVAEFLGAYIRGDDWWCQGFSEPGAGSDLASLTTRAVPQGSSFVVTGQKVWTTMAQYAQRCILLARTGEPGSAHRGITAFFVDMGSPGVSVRPLRGMNGDDEFSEVFFDDVAVPDDRIIGQLNGGWDVAMAILACERATIFWTRAAWLQDRLRALLTERDPAVPAAEKIGQTYQLLASLRARSWATQRDVAAHKFDPAKSSIDKVMMAASEQSLFDTALELLGDRLLFSDDVEDERWRSQYLYSRASSIYGGTGEIQRNIISERLLGLPRS